MRAIGIEPIHRVTPLLNHELASAFFTRRNTKTQSVSRLLDFKVQTQGRMKGADL
jgi:hypothetical protein